jgi:hypothetical protein
MGEPERDGDAILLDQEGGPSEELAFIWFHQGDSQFPQLPTERSSLASQGNV